jgi:hypothetical protein
MPPRSPRKEERDGTTGRNHPMKLPKWLATDEPANAPRGQLDSWDRPEDFAADARAEVSQPKGGRS